MAPVGIGHPDLRNPAIRQERGGCADCPQWDKCLFNNRRYGGFKAQGHHNVGYRLITDRAELNSAKEDFVSCEIFTDVILDRMLNGRELRARGLDGEVISIIAQEGETVSQRFQVPFNSRSEVVRPQRHLVEPLKKAGWKVNLDDLTSPAEFRYVTLEIEVPAWKSPGVLRDDYSLTLVERERSREKSEDDIETEAWQQAKVRQAQEDVQPTEKATAKAEPLKRSQ